MAMSGKNGKEPSGPRARGGVWIEPRGRSHDAASMIDALGLLVEPRGIAAEARFLGARVDPKGRVSLVPDLPPASARLERVRAWRASRSFAAALELAGIPATLVKPPPEGGRS